VTTRPRRSGGGRRNWLALTEERDKNGMLSPVEFEKQQKI